MKNTIELKKVLDRKINKIDYINDKINIYKANGCLSQLINLKEISNEKTLEAIDSFLDTIRDKKQKVNENVDYYDLTNAEIIDKLTDKQLIDFIEYLEDYSYELICDMREYRSYKKELDSHEIGDIWY
ncbi:MAG: hypothetical protein E7C94_02490 [Finegoldia magna]|uniref:hypothetical protein n=1 Tax=Finegoldia magna TaxID=1260 RepID=UPI00290547AE|nr:hypothetical protein [Finegoldia magna]MDU2574778.1 hypothetical protein [Finegoldia magna]